VKFWEIREIWGKWGTLEEIGKIKEIGEN